MFIIVYKDIADILRGNACNIYQYRKHSVSNNSIII
jgi:hypothetical protein